MLNTTEILEMVQPLIPCIQVCPANLLKLHDGVIYAIINTKPMNHPGEHWTAIYWDRRSDYLEFFCPLGGQISDITCELLQSYGVNDYMYNPVMIQHPLSSHCGFFCIYYILSKRFTSMKMKELVKPFYQCAMENDNICVNKILDIISKVYK